MSLWLRINKYEKEKKDNQWYGTISLDSVLRAKEKKREREFIFFPASSYWPCSYDIDSTLEIADGDSILTIQTTL